MQRPSYAERLALIAILAVGAWLRFQHMGDIEYNIDQAYPVWQAIRTLDAGDLPLVGQGTSVLFANPPLTGYFFVPFLALARQPVMAYAVTLLLNTFAIWLAYRGLRWLIGTRPALIGAALFAVNPWIIEDSRRTWVQSLAPFFVTLIFWALAPVLTGQTRHPRRRMLIALVGLALFAHTYLLAYALIAPVALLIVMFWRWRPGRIPWRAVIAGGAVFALLMAVFAVGLIRQWDDTRSRAENFTSGGARLSDEALTHAVRLVTGWDYAEARGVHAPADDADLRQTLGDLVHDVWALALAAGILRAVKRLFYRRGRGERREHGEKEFKEESLLSFSSSVSSVRSVVKGFSPDAAVILLVWLAAPVLLMSYVSRVVHPFYLLLTVPAGHGLAVWGVAPLLRRRSTLAAVIGFLVFTGAINGLNTVRFAQNTAAYPGEDLPETLPLAQATASGDLLHAAGAPDRAVFSPMGDWTPVTLVGHDFRVEQVSHDYAGAVLVPPHGAVYMQFTHVWDSATLPPLGAQPAGSLPLDDGALILLWAVTPGDIEITHPADIPSDIDVRFAGWTLRVTGGEDLAPGAAAELFTFWRIDALHPDRGIWNFAPFAHLIDGGGATVANADGIVIPALAWAAGDLMAQRMIIRVPDESAGPYVIRVGLFDSVRAQDNGAPGINAIFRVPGAGGEAVYTAEIEIRAGE